MTSPAAAASTTSQANGEPCAAQIAIETSATVRSATSRRRNVASGKRRPSRAIGRAPPTCASVMASIMAAPPLVSPVWPSATSEKAIGPAACGTPSVAEEMNQRSSFIA